MINISVKLPAVCLLIVWSVSAVIGQQKFEGYSLVVEAGKDGACPIRYLPGADGGNGVDVFLAGTNQKTPAAGLSACDGSQANGSRVGPNGFGKWCFEGKETIYDVRLRNGTSYLWYPITKDTGFYNVKDFRPVTRSGGANPQYQFNDPADYTQTIKNAVAFIASRQGGTLQFPDGDYVVGTTDGNTRDPKYEAVTLPSGIVVQGSSSNASVPTTDLPLRTGSTRIRLRNENQSIFRVGGCTNQVTIRNIELLGNSALFREAKRSSSGDYGVEAVGKWAINPASGQQSPNSSQVFKVENVTFQNLDKGIYVHNANDDKCNTKDQICGIWQFDHAVVDHGIFINNKTGIWIDTYNTDWKITNSVLNYTAANPPGDGIHIQTAGAVLIEQSWGGGYDYGQNIGGTFIWVGTLGSLVVINSGSENGQRSIYMHPFGGISSLMMTVIGSIFSDKIELNGRMNYISSGSFYGAKTIVADPSVMITSTGDRFCYDATVLPGRCTDNNGKTTANPNFTGGKVMFQTGRPGEGAGANRIDGKPNFFGYNVELGDGLMQFDPNITYKDITAWAAGGDNRPQLKDGALVYCKDCKKNSAGNCTKGQAGVDGVFAKRINGQWRCD